MAHRISKGGSYKLDRAFPGVGRIGKASGATTKAGFKARNNMLTRLYDKGRLDILRAIKDGDVTITESLRGRQRKPAGQPRGAREGPVSQLVDCGRRLGTYKCRGGSNTTTVQGVMGPTQTALAAGRRQDPGNR